MGDYVAKGPHTLALRRLQASQAALTADLFGTRPEAWAFGAVAVDVGVRGRGKGRSGRNGLLAKLSVIYSSLDVMTDLAGSWSIKILY